MRTSTHVIRHVVQEVGVELVQRAELLFEFGNPRCFLVYTNGCLRERTFK